MMPDDHLAELRRGYQATQATPDRGGRWNRLADGGPCPECGAPRQTAESLRVHRWLAHDVRAAG